MKIGIWVAYIKTHVGIAYGATTIKVKMTVNVKKKTKKKNRFCSVN